MNTKPHVVFRCRKCGHLLFCDIAKLDDSLVDTANKILKMDCPTCGEEPDEWEGLWTLLRFGNHAEEYENK